MRWIRTENARALVPSGSGDSLQYRTVTLSGTRSFGNIVAYSGMKPSTDPWISRPFMVSPLRSPSRTRKERPVNHWEDDDHLPEPESAHQFLRNFVRKDTVE